MKYKIEFELSKEQVDLLKLIKKHGYAEYRDTEFESLDHFISQKGQEDQTCESFLSRNTGGTLHIAHSLYKDGFVDYDMMSWHGTYILTDLGQKLFAQNDLD